MIDVTTMTHSELMETLKKITAELKARDKDVAFSTGNSLQGNYKIN